MFHAGMDGLTNHTRAARGIGVSIACQLAQGLASRLSELVMSRQWCGQAWTIEAEGFSKVRVFCDESGGTAEAEGVFVMAAVRVQPREAARLIKRARRVAGVSGELKGTHLTSFARRRRVFDVLWDFSDACAVSVVCSRDTRTGGWAMDTVPERDLWAELVIESCARLPPIGRSFPVIVDGGRYSKVAMAKLKAVIDAGLGAKMPGVRPAVSYGDSAAEAGLQVADIIANTVRQAHGTTAAHAAEAIELAKELVEASVRRGQLTVHQAQLTNRVPRWMTAELLT